MNGSLTIFRSSLFLSAFILCLMLARELFAANDGTLGATSTGDVNISVVKPALVQVSGMSDLTLSSYKLGDGDQRLSTTVCVYSSTAYGGYRVFVTGDGVGGAYTLSNGGSNTLAYSVIWNSGGAGGLGTTGDLLTYLGDLNVDNASTTSFDCNANANPTAQLNIEFTQANLDAAPAGTYTGLITVLVTPN
jgi:hypothetical protein